jgi:hypothetical protein
VTIPPRTRSKGEQSEGETERPHRRSLRSPSLKAAESAAVDFTQTLLARSHNAGKQQGRAPAPLQVSPARLQTAGEPKGLEEGIEVGAALRSMVGAVLGKALTVIAEAGDWLGVALGRPSTS